MRGIPSSFLVLFFAFIFFVELCSYLGIRQLIKRQTQNVRGYLFLIYFLFSSIVIGLLLFSFSNPDRIRESHNYGLFYVVIFFSILNILPKTVFAFFTILSYLFRWLLGTKSQLVVLSGSFVLASGVFLIICYGNLWGRRNIEIKKYDLYFNDLPQQMDGLRIVQLSDIHLGSFNKNFKVIQETVQLVNLLKPDLLLFTGDLVNNFSDELTGYEPYFQQLSSRYGKYAIQGNHDYGDYSNWPDSTSKKKNLEDIRNGFSNCGFDLLLNRWTKISVRDTSFALIGVENWGHPPFPQYAKLDQAMEGIPEHTFRILMSHDPEHWNSIIVPKTDIPLTLSGHTHGGQFGIRIAGIDFSPVYLYQKYWGGLYESDNQYLYVNRGLGTIGYQGRVEMSPEITVLTLHPAKNR